MAGTAFAAAAPLRILTGGAPPPALARRRRPRCALAPLADAAGEASRRRVLKAADGGKVVRAEREKRREAAGRKREEERRVKEVERGKREAAEAKIKAAEAKAKAAEVKAKAVEAKASEEAKAKAVEAKAAEAKAAEARKAAEAEVRVRAEAGAKAKAEVEVKAKATAAVEAKRKLAEARDEAGNSGAADLMKKSRELGKGEAVGGLVSKGAGDNPSPLAGSDGIDVALDGKIVIVGATVESEEFFVASQDSPNVSPPPLADGSASAGSGGSVVGTPQAAAEGAGEEAMLLFTEGEHAFLFSDTSDPSKIKLSTVEDVTSVSAPQTATPSLAPKPPEKPRAGASDGAGGTGEPVKVGESVGVREGVGKSSAGDIVGTPRFFSLRRVTQAGESARKEISRAMARGSTVEDSKAVKVSSRREFVRFAGDGLLIITLMLLLQTGVSRTMRWVHSRLDRVDSPGGEKKQNFPYEQSVYECMQKPLEFLSVFIVGTALAEAVSRPLAATGLVRYIRTLRELGVIFSATWFILRWIERISLRFAVDKRIDKAQVDASSRVATVLTTVIAILISLDTVGVNVQTVLAFGGIGGVAIGFAGREIISNFFGGFMIFLTRPFSVGEWIRSIEEPELNGTVEDIGWYLSRVRTWDKRPLYIPNSRFSTLIVENPSRMTNRRILHTLHMRLEDMPVVQDVTAGIDRYMRENQELDPKQHRLAYVDSFDEFSVKIWISCYTKSVFLFDWRRVQQDVLVAVYGILRENGARLASMTTRDVRPGTDPDRYGPFGSSGAVRNQPAAHLSSEPTRVAGNPGLPSGLVDDNEAVGLTSLGAEIESGVVSAIDVAGAGNSLVPEGSTELPLSGSASGFANNIARSDAVSGGSAAGSTGSLSADSIAKTVRSAGIARDGTDMFRGRTRPSNAADALEMAAAAILAAKNNQMRSDGRQNEANRAASLLAREKSNSVGGGPPTGSASVGDGGKTTISAANVVGTGENPSKDESEARRAAAIVAAAAAAAAADLTQVGNVSSEGSGGGASNAAPGSGGKDVQLTGQMKISAAPKIGTDRSPAAVNPSSQSELGEPSPPVGTVAPSQTPQPRVPQAQASNTRSVISQPASTVQDAEAPAASSVLPSSQNFPLNTSQAAKPATGPATPGMMNISAAPKSSPSSKPMPEATEGNSNYPPGTSSLGSASIVDSPGDDAV